MYYSSFEEIVSQAEKISSRTVMAVPAADEHSIEAALMAAERNIVEPVFIGNVEEINSVLAKNGRPCRVIEAPDPAEAAGKAVAMVRSGEAGFILKGNLDTKVILKEVVNKEHGLSTGRIMSHFTIFQIPNYHKLIAIVDGGMMTYPNLEQKADIIRNTVEVFLKLGYEKPKVGVLACVEKLNPKMPETVDGDALKTMCLNGEIENCIVEGPISYDCAVSAELAAFKKYESPCAGDCDILLVPNIHAGNFLGKMITVTAGGQMAGFIVGAKCPIAMTSRGSSIEEKFISIVLAALAAGEN